MSDSDVLFNSIFINFLQPRYSNDLDDFVFQSRSNLHQMEWILGCIPYFHIELIKLPEVILLLLHTHRIITIQWTHSYQQDYTRNIIDAIHPQYFSLYELYLIIDLFQDIKITNGNKLLHRGPTLFLGPHLEKIHNSFY